MTTVCRAPLPTTLWHRHNVYACIFYVYVYARERWGRERGASLYMFIVMIYVCALSSSSRSLFMCFSGFGGRPEGRGGISSVGYFQKLPSLAGSSRVTYPCFKSADTINENSPPNSPCTLTGIVDCQAVQT